MFNRDLKTDVKTNGQPDTPTAYSAGAKRPASATPAEPNKTGSSPATHTPPDREKGGSKLVVGPDIKLRGVEITDCDTLYVEGHVQASLDARLVQIAEKGTFSGSAAMDVAEVWGTFDGELTARSQLIIHATGRVSGTIHYGSIRIEEGGEVCGKIDAIAQADKKQYTTIRVAAFETKEPAAAK
jgi:cytoskeletal protein CcmA (bactofilin family)